MTCNLQSATCNLQPATCNLHLQPATCKLHPPWVDKVFNFFSPIPKHSYCWMCQNDVLEWSGMILSGFGNVLIGNTMATCLESNYQVNKKHSCKLMFFSCFKLQLGVEFLPWIIARIFCRNYLKHFLKKGVLASSVLFAVTTSCKLWIVKLANKENLFLLDFLKIQSKKV